MNLKRFLIIFPLAGFASCAVPTSTSDGPAFAPEMRRASVDVGYSSNGTGIVNGAAFQLGGSYGYFMTESVELGVGADFESVNRAAPSDNLTNLFLNAYSRYYTNSTSATRPYLELGLGYGNASVGSFDEDVLAYLGSIGILHFIDADRAIEFSIEKTFYHFPDITGGNTDSLSGSVGMSWFF